MVFHRNQAQFERAKWRKALLLPLWALQVAMLLSLMGIFSYRLAETVEHYQENQEKGKVPTVEFVWECTNIGLSVVALILTVMEVAKLFSETLTPFFMLASHVVKMTCSFAILALDIVVYIDRSEGNWSIIGLAIDCGLLASMLSLGIYSIVKFRRLLAYDDYHHPVNVKAFGFSNGYNEIEMSGGLGGGNDSYLRASPYNDVTTDYPSQSSSNAFGASAVTSGGPGISGAGGVIDAAGHNATRAAATGGTRARAVSAAGSLRRISGSSLRRIASKSPTPSPSNERPNPFEDASGRRESYNHERSTQFDEYVSRGSAALSKEDIDQAIGAELWGGAGSRASNEVRSNSLVGTGMVAAQTAQPGNADHAIIRTSSWKVEHVSDGSPIGSYPAATSAGVGVGVGASSAVIVESMSPGGNSGIVPIAEVREEDENDDNQALAAALGRGRNLTAATGEDRSLLMGHQQTGPAGMSARFDEDGEDDDDRVRPLAHGP